MPQLTLVQRYQIQTQFRNGLSGRAIARELDIWPSTVIREIKRNGDPDAFRIRDEAVKAAANLADRQAKDAGESPEEAATSKRAAMAAAAKEVGAELYDHEDAEEKRLARRRHVGGRSINVSAEDVDGVLDEIASLLGEGHSPEQARQKFIRRQGYAPASHTWVYAHIRLDRVLKGDLYRLLRRRGKKRRSAQGDGRGQIPDRTPIDERPAAADDRKEVGHWEIDTVIGAGHRGAVLTAVDRHSRFLAVALLPDRTAASVLAALPEMLAGHPVHTLTADNGKEFTSHKEVAERLGAGFYFAKPYQPWQRGSNENANGLLRYFLPKGTDFTRISPRAAQDAAERINALPMRLLGWRSRKEAHWQDVHRQRALQGAQDPPNGQREAA